MKSHIKSIIVAVLMLLAAPAFAQIQKGYVRTVGRPNNPKGTRISGITIRVAGLHSPVVSQSNGSFEIDLGGGQTSYAFTSVRDNSYQYELQEKELLNRSEPVSVSVPREIVMVSLAEKRAIEEKKRQQIENQYQKDIAQLEAQKAQNEITIEQYRQQLQELQDAFDKRDMLITELSEHFASIDYATLTEDQARISALLEDGDLLTADSIINAKGSIEERMGTFFDFRDENNKAAATLEQRRADEDASLEDLKKDCEAKFLIYKQKHKLDTAKYYLQLLVSLDTTNVASLLGAGEFCMEYLTLYDEAFDYYQCALRHSLEQFGANNQRTENCYNDLGYICILRNKQEEALTYLDKALEIGISQLGENSSDVATCYNNIGILYDERGDYATALQYYEKSLEIRKEVFGENHLKVATGYNNVGYIFQKQGDNKKAMEYYTKALEIRQNILGETHQLVAISYNNIGSQHFLMGDYAKAAEYYEKALAIRKIVFGEKHPQVATSYNNIGALYYYQGNHAKAAEYYEKALGINISLLGEENQTVATNYSNIGVLYFTQKEYEKALNFHNKALRIRQLLYPENHPDIANSYANLGNLWLAQDSLERALQSYKKALQILNSAPDAKQSDAAISYFHVGRIYNRLNDPVAALENFFQAYDINLALFGEENNKTKRAREFIEQTYEKVKDNSDKKSKAAVKLYKKWIKLHP